jgi:transposase-like protein
MVGRKVFQPWERVVCHARKWKRHSAEFKARVAFEAVKGVKTVQQLGKDFQVHPASSFGRSSLQGRLSNSLNGKRGACYQLTTRNYGRPMKRLAAWTSNSIG